MAIAFDAATGRNVTSSASSQTFPHTITGTNPILFVGVTVQTGDILTGITYNGVAMTQVTKKSGPGSDYQYLYYLLNPTTGTNNVVITLSGSATFILSYFASYTGVDQTGQPDNSTTNTAASATSIATSLTTVANNCWTIVYAENDQNGFSAGAGTTLRGTSTTQGLGDSNGAITPPGSTTLTLNWSGSGAASSIMASFSPFGTHSIGAGLLLNFL